MKAYPLGQQGNSDQQQETQCQDLQSGSMVDEVADGSACIHHDDYGDDHRCNHDEQLICHSYRRDDGVKREDDVQNHDLDDDPREGCARPGGRMPLFPLKLVVDFKGAFRKQKQATDGEDETSSRDVVIHDLEERVRQLGQPGKGQQQ